MDMNKVSVKIYGQDYIIAGEKSRDHIIKVADYVSTRMYEVAAAMQGAPLSSLAVLSAVNVADDYFDALEEANRLKLLNTQLEKDAEHYVQLWEESKRTFLEYKKDGQLLVQQKNEMTKTIEQQSEEIRKLRNQSEDLEAKTTIAAQETINELESKCRELENSFFDIQMENIRLKSELDRMRKGE